MIQQINLYQPLFRRQKKVFSASAMLMVTGIVVGALVIITGIAEWQLHVLQAQYQQAQTREQLVTSRLTELSTQLTGASDQATLKTQVAQLEDRLQARRTAMARLSTRAAGNTYGFSAQLAGLARQIVDGLWLTGVTLEAGGTRVDLAGRTVVPALLPAYVQKLGQEPAFNKLQFESLRIYRLEDTRRYVGFVLSSDSDTQKNPESGT